MSGKRRLLSSTVSSILRACACAAPFSRIAARLLSARMNGGTEAWYIEIVMRVSARALALAVFVLERDFHLRAVRFDLAFVVERQIQLRDFGHPQIAQGLAGSTDGRGSSLLPRLRAGANELDDLVDAFSHGRVLRG